jgi:hypothetical protein
MLVYVCTARINLKTLHFPFKVYFYVPYNSCKKQPLLFLLQDALRILRGAEQNS